MQHKIQPVRYIQENEFKENSILEPMIHVES
jgi:hypothetical protein